MIVHTVRRPRAGKPVVACDAASASASGVPPASPLNRELTMSTVADSHGTETLEG